jgi:predicted dehydrogenase
MAVVTSWDKAHKEHALAVLRRNCHLFLEKPMAQTIADCDAILRAWEDTTATMVIGHEMRFSPLITDMRRLLDAGEIGAVKLASAVDNVSVGGQYYFHGQRRRKAFIKSLMLEKGTHSLDLMNAFIGSSPIRVFAESGLDVFGGKEPNDKRCVTCADRGTCPHAVADASGGCVWAEEIDVEDNCVCTVRYANGAKLTYTECHFTPDYNHHYTLIGDQGRMVAAHTPKEFLIRVEKRFTGAAQDYRPPGAGPGHGDTDHRIVEDFLARALSNEHTCDKALDARNSAAIAIAAAESWSTHLPVTIPTFTFRP